MVRSIVLGANTRLNDIPTVNVVSNMIRRMTIVVGHPGLDYHVITQKTFGTYAQVNDEPDLTIGWMRRTTGAIALNTVGTNKDLTISYPS